MEEWRKKAREKGKTTEIETTGRLILDQYKT